MMGSLLSELGKKVAERWLSLLVLPGALYLAVVVAARTLGHGDPFDVVHLTGRVTAWAGAPAAGTVGGQVVLLAAVLAGAAAVGVAAQAIGSLAERLHLAPDWPAWPLGVRHLAHWRTTHRQRRWTAAATAWHQRQQEAARALTRGVRTEPAERHAAYGAMTRISLELPDRPTWSGDRIHAAHVRLERDGHLDLAAVWPHIWLMLPDPARTEITTARQDLSRGAVLSAWALLYLPLTIWWWPAGVITVVLILAGRHRVRSAADVYATLLEAATRLYARELAQNLGFEPPAGPLPRELGDALSRFLTPSPPQPGSPAVH